jgi:23S rRNA pseudouridine1911/1915/1917 synthase
VGGVERPGIVHRIDKDTSGLLVVAKHDAAHNALAEQLKTHTVARVYYAIAIGNLREDHGTVHAPIGRHPTDRKRMAITRREGEGKDAITHYEVLERYGSFTYIKCKLETGRTHQIRVHMASLGHPLLGDPVYGGNGTRFEALHRRLLHGQCLHAGELALVHPRTGEEIHFTAPLPRDLAALLEILRREANA